jgi:quercetin dioxygenase-like cupin family protein
MKRAEHQPETISVTIYGGVFYKLWRVPEAGTLVPQHAHEYDHLTALLQGAVRVWCNGEMVGDYRAPATLKIAAGDKHGFMTLTPGAVFACIHNADHLDDGEPVVAERHDIELED